MRDLAAAAWDAAHGIAAAAQQKIADGAAHGCGGRPEGLADQTPARQAVIVAQQHIAEKDRADSPTGGGAAQAIDDVQKYIDSLKQERDVMQASDPVQQEMIKNRDLLSKATGAQRDEVEQLVAAQQQEASLADAMNAFGQASYDALSGMIL